MQSFSTRTLLLARLFPVSQAYFHARPPHDDGAAALADPPWSDGPPAGPPALDTPTAGADRATARAERESWGF